MFPKPTKLQHLMLIKSSALHIILENRQIKSDQSHQHISTSQTKYQANAFTRWSFGHEQHMQNLTLLTFFLTRWEILWTGSAETADDYNTHRHSTVVCMWRQIWLQYISNDNN